MAGRLVTKRGMTDKEFTGMVRILSSDTDKTVMALSLRAWFTDLAVEKYMAGYQCGYKRGKRGTMKEDFDEDDEG